MTALDARPEDWDHHLLLVHHTEGQRRTGVAAWVRRGLELGEKILYTEPPDQSPDRSLRGLLRAHGVDVRRALDEGQLRVVLADTTAYDPAWQSSVVAEALDLGYPSVRWGGEEETALRVLTRGRYAGVEQATDELCQVAPVSVLCMYSAAHPGDLLRFACGVHSGGLRCEGLRVAPTREGAALCGGIDLCNAGVAHAALCALSGSAAQRGGGRFTLDLTGLDFLDVNGARSLVSGTAGYRDRGGGVRLSGVRQPVGRLLRLLDVGRADGIMVEEG